MNEDDNYRTAPPKPTCTAPADSWYRKVYVKAPRVFTILFGTIPIISVILILHVLGALVIEIVPLTGAPWWGPLIIGLLTVVTVVGGSFLMFGVICKVGLEIATRLGLER